MEFPKPTKQEKTRKPLKRSPIKRKSTASLSKEKAKAWKYFSLWVRLSAADSYGFVQCVTCPQKRHYKEMQAGHFIPGRTNSVLFFIDGVHPQCYSCNVMKHGNWPAYYEYMKKMYGLEVIDELILCSKEPVKFTIDAYRRTGEVFKKMVEELNLP